MNSKHFLVILFMAMLILPMASALELDNVKNYDPISREATFYNSFLGIPTTEIGKARLNTPLNVKVGAGYNKVAEFDLWAYTDYSDALKQFSFTDLKTKQKINRNYDLKVLSYETITVNDYETIEDGLTANGTIKYKQIVSGTHLETIEKWTKVTPADLKKKDKLTIGVFTEVQVGDFIDWVPMIYGVEIKEWATWTADLNVNLIHYYSFDDGSGTMARNNITNNNLTLTGSPSWISGKVGGALNFTGAGKYALSSSNVDISGSNSRTVAFWYNNYNLGSGEATSVQWGSDVNEKQFIFNQYLSKYTITSYSKDYTTTRAIATGWEFHTVTLNGNNLTYWVNAVPITSFTFTGSTANSVLQISNDGTWPTAPITASIDELGIWNRSLTSAEISQLYNSGTGITYMSSFDSSPSITFNSPASSNFTTSPQNLVINFTAKDDINLTDVKLYVNGVLNQTNASGLNNTNYLFNLDLGDGIYNIYGKATDNNSAVTVTNNITIFIDSIAPIVYINSPSNNSELITFTGFYSTPFNVSIVHPGNLGTCLYYNGSANNSITCGNNVTLNLSNGYKTLAYYANDTLGNAGTNSTNILINYLRPGVNYSLAGVEGETTRIYFNISGDYITQVNATLNYNGTLYNMNLSHNLISYMNNTYTAVFYSDITLPLVTADTVKQFNISYYVNNLIYNTTLYSQTTYNIPALNVTAGTCTGTPIYAFTLKDEENQTIISGDFEYNFYYGLSNSSSVRSYGKISGSSTFSICTNSTISTSWIIGSGEIAYNAPGYVNRRYYIFDNTNVSTVTNLTLYDLLSTTQTSFKLEVEDTSLNPYSNIYTRLLRWYPDLNTYNIVDMGKTDELGSTVIHVRTEDKDYRIGAYETNGSLIYLADPIRMVCLASPCTYTLKISPGEVDYTSFLNVVYTLTYNETTGIWNFVYSDTTGKTSTMNLTVYRVTSTTEYPVCSQQISGAVGALSCNTSIYTTGILRAEVYRSASPPVEIAQKVVHLFTSAFKGSTFGLWLSLLLALPIIFLMCLISPIGALVGGVIALLPAFYLGSINLGIIGGIAILAGIVAHFLKRIS